MLATRRRSNGSAFACVLVSSLTGALAGVPFGEAFKLIDSL
jgi:hypothetical protein